MRITQTPQEINDIVCEEGNRILKEMLLKYPCDKLYNFDIILNTLALGLSYLQKNFTDGNVDNFIKIVDKIIRQNARAREDEK